MTGSNVTNYTNRDWALPKTGAIDGIRTRDLSLTKRVLCQLSYDGNSLVFNPSKAKVPKYIRPGSNRGPLACEASVITN